MIPDFRAAFMGQITVEEATKGMTVEDLHPTVNGLYDEIEAIVKDVTDKDVAFVPIDADLKDTENEQAWTLGHVIVHLTAGMEEAALAANILASNIPFEARLRYETPWETVTTAAQIHQRLAESRRMINGYLAAFPDKPALDNKVVLIPRLGAINFFARVGLGLFHTDSHLAQLREIVRQAKAA